MSDTVKYILGILFIIVLFYVFQPAHRTPNNKSTTRAT